MFVRRLCLLVDYLIVSTSSLIGQVEFESDRGISWTRAYQMLERARRRHKHANGRRRRPSHRRGFGADDGFYSWTPHGAKSEEYILMLERRRSFSHGFSRDPVFAAYFPHVRFFSFLESLLILFDFHLRGVLNRVYTQRGKLLRWNRLRDDYDNCMTLAMIQKKLTKRDVTDEEVKTGWTAQFNISETACSTWYVVTQHRTGGCAFVYRLSWSYGFDAFMHGISV